MSQQRTIHPDEVIDFWFGNQQRWYSKDSSFDKQIEKTFGQLLQTIGQGLLNDWCHNARNCLAFVIVTDQFPRNIFRDLAKAYAYDSLALKAALEGVARGFDQELSLKERSIFYLPLMHAEDLDLQVRSVQLFKQLVQEADESLKPAMEEALKFAIQHHDIIAQFGRYPHRNHILGRKETQAEKEFMEKTPITF